MSATHAAAPPEGMECVFTYEDIDADSYCEYQTAPSLLWRAAKVGDSAAEQLRTTQFKAYMERMQKTDCQAELKRLLASGPPTFVYDAVGLPLPDGETHVAQLWSFATKSERSALCEGASVGDARQKQWDELISIHAATQDADAATDA
eukprot:CAMPEP_0184118666 /NCGR_PEP_ID=MMETSP0974-20121125/21557_1 /TAXON_ID=483370 /ORGANISM="non described non described, Strain CCMP2097" /LENGTH=147 /DNA_ID=CAMNT_0026421815 /DNA_START=89 /DNA_END=528 /DNA_ORIENTATION=-